jgi:hypothetical protein
MYEPTDQADQDGNTDDVADGLGQPGAANSSLQAHLRAASP